MEGTKGFELLSVKGMTVQARGTISISPQTRFEDLRRGIVSLCCLPNQEVPVISAIEVCSRSKVFESWLQCVPVHAHTDFKVLLQYHGTDINPLTFLVVTLKAPTTTAWRSSEDTLRYKVPPPCLLSKSLPSAGDVKYSPSVFVDCLKYYLVKKALNVEPRNIGRKSVVRKMQENVYFNVRGVPDICPGQVTVLRRPPPQPPTGLVLQSARIPQAINHGQAAASFNQGQAFADSAPDTQLVPASCTVTKRRVNTWNDYVSWDNPRFDLEYLTMLVQQPE